MMKPDVGIRYRYRRWSWLKALGEGCIRDGMSSTRGYDIPPDFPRKAEQVRDDIVVPFDVLAGYR
jgi:hypothetical protein